MGQPTSRRWRVSSIVAAWKNGCAFAGFNVDAETIVAGLEKVTAVKPKIGHLLKAEHEESGNYYVDMVLQTLN